MWSFVYTFVVVHLIYFNRLGLSISCCCWRLCVCARALDFTHIFSVLLFIAYSVCVCLFACRPVRPFDFVDVVFCTIELSKRPSNLRCSFLPFVCAAVFAGDGGGRKHNFANILAHFDSREKRFFPFFSFAVLARKCNQGYTRITKSTGHWQQKALAAPPPPTTSKNVWLFSECFSFSLRFVRMADREIALRNRLDGPAVSNAKCSTKTAEGNHCACHWHWRKHTIVYQMKFCKILAPKRTCIFILILNVSSLSSPPFPIRINVHRKSLKFMFAFATHFPRDCFSRRPAIRTRIDIREENVTHSKYG